MAQCMLCSKISFCSPYFSKFQWHLEQVWDSSWVHLFGWAYPAPDRPTISKESSSHGIGHRVVGLSTVWLQRPQYLCSSDELGEVRVFHTNQQGVSRIIYVRWRSDGWVTEERSKLQRGSRDKWCIFFEIKIKWYSNLPTILISLTYGHFIYFLL